RPAPLPLRAGALVLGRRDQPVRLSSPGGGSRAQPPARGVHGRTGSSKAATCARHPEPGSTTPAVGCLLLVLGRWCTRRFLRFRVSRRRPSRAFPCLRDYSATRPSSPSAVASSASEPRTGLPART